MNADPALIWAYLTQGPLLWLTATLAAYAFGTTVFRLSRGQSWANPVLIAVVLLGLLLTATGTPYATYFEGAQFVHFLLGPATVCLALPMHDNLPRMRAAALPILAGLAAGSLVAVASALAIARAFGLGGEVMASLAPKSTTAPVAIGIAERLGGQPTLTAVLVLTTGIFGAMVVTPLFNALGFRDWRARGLAVGTAAHGIGTARALQVNPTAGAFAGIGMGLNAVLTAILADYPTAGMAAYSASKAAISAWLTALRPEQRRRGVTVFDIRPPHIETGLAGPAVEIRAVVGDVQAQTQCFVDHGALRVAKSPALSVAGKFSAGPACSYDAESSATSRPFRSRR